MYKVWHKRVYSQFPGIGKSRPETVIKIITHCTICVTMIHMVFQPQIWVSLHQFLEIVSKLFCVILYTHSGMCSIPMPQPFLCSASTMGENLFIDCFVSIRGNILKLRIKPFGPCSIHTRLCSSTRNNIFNSWGICYDWFNIWCGDHTQIWS